MSYLNPIRLHFAGTFKADPSTVNNSVSNFDPQVTDPNPMWNPDGTGNWDFIDVKVTRVCYADGSHAGHLDEDPIVGAPLRGTNNPFPGKIVDLDPEQQMVSQIWAFELMVGELPSKNSVVGSYLVAPFNDIWTRRQGPGSRDMAYCAYYQSVLENLAWARNLDSRFLEELRAATGSRVSIKFNVDMYQPNSSDPDFTHGRIVGTIGPADDLEPARFVAGRLLRPQTATTCFAQFIVNDTGRAIVDLGNSLTCDANGAVIDQGPLQLVAGGAPVGEPIQEYAVSDWYRNTAGVVEIDPNGVDLSSTPLSIEAGGSPLLQENSAGAYLRAYDYVYRLNPGETGQVELMALSFGKPALGVTVELSYDANMLQPASGIQVAEPRDALTFPDSVSTDPDGRATVALEASDPGNPRQFIDGQIYGVGYAWGDAVSEYNPDSSNFISVHVYDSCDYGDSPTWDQDVGPVFSQFDKLYPVMGSLNLADYQSVKTNAQMIWNVISLPLEAPQHMPVTRDLSRDKIAMFKKWMDNGCPQN